MGFGARDPPSRGPAPRLSPRWPWVWAGGRALGTTAPHGLPGGIIPLPRATVARDPGATGPGFIEAPIYA